jgi:hypothetical protein
MSHSYTCTHYDKTDIFYHKNDVQKRGFDASTPQHIIIQKAIEHGCPVVVKNGKRAKWYLKGKGLSYDEVTLAIEEKKGIKRDGVFTIHITSVHTQCSH